MSDPFVFALLGVPLISLTAWIIHLHMRLFQLGERLRQLEVRYWTVHGSDDGRRSKASPPYLRPVS